MNKGCPRCGSKALVSIPATRTLWGGRQVNITLYTCRCGWRGEWDELRKKEKTR